jgi:O-antigen/teichoic acid export membrane protein
LQQGLRAANRSPSAAQEVLMPSLSSRLVAAAGKLRSPALLAYGITGIIAVGSFLSTLILARLAGPAVIGDYALAMSTAHLLASFAVLGLDRILVREVAGDLRTGDMARARAVTRGFALSVMLSSVAVTLLWLGTLGFTGLNRWMGGDRLALAFAAASALVWPMQRLGRAAIRARDFPLKSQLLEALPTLAFTAAMGAFLLAGRVPTAPQAVLIMVAGQLAAAVGAWLLMAPALRSWPAGGTPPGRALTLAGLPIMSVLFLQIFSDWFLLAKISAVAGAADVGAFRVAIQVTGIVTTLISTTELYVGARLAGDFRTGRPDLAWKRHRRATALMAAVAVPPLLLFLLVPGPLLGFLFGADFTGAATALAIMAGGQLIAVARGPLGSMLTMSGNDRTQLYLTLGGLALVMLLAFLLIPRYGLTGAAIAQVAPIAFRSIAGFFIARRLIPTTPPPTD